MLSLIKFLFTQEGSPYLLFLIFEIFEAFAILSAIFFFFLRYYLDSENRAFFTVLVDFTQKLSLGKKIIFFIFIFTFAIPNKIYVHDRTHFIVKIILNFGVMALCSIFPAFILIFLIRMKFAFESYIFGYICSYTPSLRVIIVKYLFNGDDHIASLVFDFFWGNMVNSAKNVFATTAAGAFLYRAVKQAESVNIEVETDKRVTRDWERLMKDPRRLQANPENYKKTSVAELEEIKRHARQEAIDTTTVTALEQKFQKASLAALDVFMKKYG